MPYANAEGAGSKEGSRRTAGTGAEGYQSSPSAGRKRSCANALKEAEVGAAAGGGRRRLQRVRFAQRIRDGSQPPGGPWVLLFDSTSEGEQVEVEGSVLRCEKAEEGSNIGWHVETLRVHPKPCTQDVDVRKATTAARISHGVSSAKGMADMEPRLRIEKGRHCMQILKRTLRRIVLCFVVCQVESRRKRVRLEHHTRKETKGVVKGSNSGNKRHQFERGDAVGATRGSREGEGGEEAVEVAPEAQILSMSICFRSIHRDKQRRHVAQIAQRTRKWRGNGRQRRAAVIV
eukprot:2859123-Pleurochrysis_carterae.AAC.2